MAYTIGVTLAYIWQTLAYCWPNGSELLAFFWHRCGFFSLTLGSIGVSRTYMQLAYLQATFGFHIFAVD